MALSRFARPLIVPIAGLLLLWAAALGVLLRDRGTGGFPTSETIDSRFSARPGMNLDREDLAPETLDATLAQLASQGITFVRFTLPWDEIEPSRGRFIWEPWDAVAAAFAAQPTLHPVVVLDRSPAWARTPADHDNPLAPPHERRDFGTFVAAVAARYGEHFTYYQLWDEPNIAPHWGARAVDPAGYLGLLREGAVNIRANDPDARILAAALAPTVEPGGANLSDIGYLDQLYSLGAREWFDYPAAQPYGFDQGPEAFPDASQLNFARAALLREVMIRHGDAATPLWATSFGWTGYSRENTRAAFERVRQEWTWLGPLIWTVRYPAPAETKEVMAQAGRLGAGVLGPGRFAPDAPALHYQGWRATPLAADPSADGDTVEFTFSGRAVALEVQGGPYWAYLTVSVDGGPANRLPRDESGQSYLVLHDPSHARRVVPLAEWNGWDEHRVQLTAHGGWGQWPLRAVLVTTERPAVSGLGLALLALALLSTYVLRLVFVRRAPRDLTGPSRATTTAELSGGPRAAIWLLALGLCVLYLLSGSGTLNLVVLALLGLLFLVRPELAPPLIAAALPWWQRTQPVLRWQFGLFEVLAWLALLAWIGRLLLPWLFPRIQGPAGRAMMKIDIIATLLSLAGLLATLFAPEQGVAWREFRIVFLFGLVFYLLITRSPGDATRERVLGLVAGLLAGATVAALAGLWQLVTGQGRVDVEGVSRIAGFYGSPNNLALILGRAAPLAAALALFGLPAIDGATRRWTWLRRAMGVVALIILAAAIATFSKGAILLGLPAGLAVVLIGGAWRSGRRWPLGFLLALIVVAALGLAILFQTPRFTGLFNFESGTSFFRLKLWQGALNMALDNPVLGVGPDNFLYAYRTRYVLPSAWQELNLSHPHNVLLDLWTRLGLVGVAVGLAALATGIRAGWRLLRAGRLGANGRATAGSWPLHLGLLGGLAATVSHGLIDNSLFLPDLMGWFVAALALFRLHLGDVQAASSQSPNLTKRGST